MIGRIIVRTVLVLVVALVLGGIGTYVVWTRSREAILESSAPALRRHTTDGDASGLAPPDDMWRAYTSEFRTWVAETAQSAFVTPDESRRIIAWATRQLTEMPYAFVPMSEELRPDAKNATGPDDRVVENLLRSQAEYEVTRAREHPEWSSADDGLAVGVWVAAPMNELTHKAHFRNIDPQLGSSGRVYVSFGNMTNERIEDITGVVTVNSSPDTVIATIPFKYVSSLNPHSVDTYVIDPIRRLADMRGDPHSVTIRVTGVTKR